jgi:hypothetical protein
LLVFGVGTTGRELLSEGSHLDHSESPAPRLLEEEDPFELLATAPAFPELPPNNQNELPTTAKSRLAAIAIGISRYVLDLLSVSCSEEDRALTRLIGVAAGVESGNLTGAGVTAAILSITL